MKLSPWKNASDRCVSLGMRLCLKKDLCMYSRSSSSEVPKLFVKRSIQDKYVPVGDTYNDWVYLGPRKVNQCQRMTEYAGPPVWKGKECNQAVKTSKIFLRFCQSSSGIYCCRKSDKPTLLPYPVSVNVGRFSHGNSIFYSFSLDNTPKVDSRKITLEKDAKIPTDVKKFSLMSTRVDGKFEDPIFFCSRQVKKENGDLVEYFYVSNKWCNWGWTLNFYLYGSLKPLSDAQRFEANAVDFGKNLRTRLTVNDKLTRSAGSFAFYGPKFHDDAHVEFFTEQEAKTSCNIEPTLLTSVEGLINSREMDTNNGTCRWKIRAPPDSVVKINFLRLYLKPRENLFTSHQSSVRNFHQCKYLAIVYRPTVY